MKPNLLIPFLLIFSLLACRPTEAPPQPTIAPSPTLPISTPSMRPAVTSIPPSLTMAPTPAATLKWTPLPTLPESESASYTLDLMETNGNCQLPCWWSITPGETSWDFASQFLAPFVVQINPIGFTTIVEDSQEKNLLTYSVPYIVEGELVVNGQAGIQFSRYYVENNHVHSINTSSYGSDDKYALPNLLRLLELPAETRIEITDAPGSPMILISLVLSFPQKGVVAIYRADANRSPGDLSTLCFWPEPSFQLQAPNEERLLADFKEGRYSDYMLLEEVVDISLDDLYTGIQESGEPCFEISNPNVP